MSVRATNPEAPAIVPELCPLLFRFPLKSAVKNPRSPPHLPLLTTSFTCDTAPSQIWHPRSQGTCYWTCLATSILLDSAELDCCYILSQPFLPTDSPISPIPEILASDYYSFLRDR